VKIGVRLTFLRGCLVSVISGDLPISMYGVSVFAAPYLSWGFLFLSSSKRNSVIGLFKNGADHEHRRSS
jgi:hypothetical protein